MNSRTLFAWVASALIHASVLVTVGALTLAGGRPAQPGVTEIAINLSAPPAPTQTVAPQPAPQPRQTKRSRAPLHSGSRAIGIR